MNEQSRNRVIFYDDVKERIQTIVQNRYVRTTKRRLLCLVVFTEIVLLAVGLLSGCGETAGAAQQAQEESSAAVKGTSEDRRSEAITIHMVTMGIGTTTDYKRIEEAINEISRRKIGVEVDWTVLDTRQWFGQYDMLLSGSVDIDLMPNFGGIARGVSQGAFLELEDLYAQYGAGIQSYYKEEYCQAGYLHGHLYGIAPQKDYADTKNITFRRDLADDLGIDTDDVKTLDDWLPVLEKVHDSFPELYGYVSNSGISLQQFDTYDWDTLGDGLGVLTNYGQDTEVVDLYETEEYENIVTAMRRWNEAGCTDPDTALSSETGADLIRSGKAFCTITTGNPGTTSEYEANTGYPCGTVPLTEPLATSANVTAVMWTIPSFAKEPEAAMKFLNLMYTDPEIMDLLNYGQEGIDYEVRADGSYGYMDDGASSCRYHPEMTWVWPNSYIGGYWEGTDPNIGTRMREFNDSARRSKALGFTFDGTNVVNETAACSNVVKQYAYGLETGALDPVSVLPVFRNSLKDAGIDRIIREKQTQLDEFLEINSGA